jgi:hypothetical protein
MTRDESVQNLLGILAEKERVLAAKKEDLKAHRQALKELAEKETYVRGLLEESNPLENLR